MSNLLYPGGADVEEHTTLATSAPPLPPEVIEKIVISGDLSALNAAQRAEYYSAVCRSLGLNQLTKPFEYLNLNGKLRLYALRDCADQLRRLHGISIYIANRERLSDIYVVTARAKDRQGREDESTGAVPVGSLKGDALANALMKAETKAKRRVTLSIAGLGWLDETELETIPQSRPVATPAVASGEDMHPSADQISSLVELARSCDVDLVRFGHHMRRLMNLSEETKVTKKFLRESMTMAQFEDAWQHYSAMLKKLVEEEVVAEADDVVDYPPLGDPAAPNESEPSASSIGEGDQHDLAELASMAEAHANQTYATPQQIAGLKRLAQQVGDDAYMDVQDMLEHHPEGLIVGVYEIVKQRLKARKATQKGEPSGTR
jgi:hypothetical protein